ncbi:PREDICTED: uncharacterized protein LOC101301588 [Fragaria vesca subsp. vesca]|uniref:uncharacterized protein LOC101301588 n=1 Tax=Fragaria vesca subsp. vesca TaxID=101020 RepID=UPI0002C2E36B|nr:PREDICTED: uncharacterized protein LOC101301588 [Fragaria vesca subsp. vesca]
MPRKLTHQRGTHPLVWLAAIICTIVSIAVIIAGIVVFAGYMVIHPRVPFIKVTQAHLENLQNDPTSLLETAITIVVRAENDNTKAHASFSDLSFTLSFQGMKIARLVANPFDVRKNDSVDFNYVVESSSIPLSSGQVDQVDSSLKRDRISFDLKGNVRARWRVGLVGSVKLWGHLNCRLNFHPSNGSYIYSPCRSRAK